MTTMDEHAEFAALASRGELETKDSYRADSDESARRLGEQLALVDRSAAAPRRSMAVRGALALSRYRYRQGDFGHSVAVARRALALTDGLEPPLHIELLLQLAEFDLF